MGIFRAEEVACYIHKKYYSLYSKDISPIKLQKSLYFLFAYWGGYIKKSELNSSFVEEDISRKYDAYLYDNRIEAWAYGPVVPDVYTNHRYAEYGCGNVEANEYVREFIDDILDDIFVMSDFKLVDISHMDNSWKKNYRKDEQYHNNEILKEDIISEYAAK